MALCILVQQYDYKSRSSIVAYSLYFIANKTENHKNTRNLVLNRCWLEPGHCRLLCVTDSSHSTYSPLPPPSSTLQPYQSTGKECIAIALFPLHGLMITRFVKKICEYVRKYVKIQSY